MSFTRIDHYEKEYADTHHDTALNVTQGVEEQPIVSPYFKRRKKRALSTGEYVEGILAGNITTLSQAITLVESSNPNHYAQAQEIIEACLPHAGKSVRIGITGVPGAGKSTFINKVSGRKTAKAEDRPGVTRGKQWVPVDKTLELLDTPGILWPKFEDPDVGVRLGFTGAIRDDVMDMEDLASRLMAYLGAHYPDALTERYKIAVEPGEPGWELLEKAGRKRGFLMSGGEVNTERMARILLDEYRAGKLGRFTLELPEENA